VSGCCYLEIRTEHKGRKKHKTSCSSPASCVLESCGLRNIGAGEIFTKLCCILRPSRLASLVFEQRFQLLPEFRRIFMTVLLHSVAHGYV
jgi:hypothetical protein